MGLHDSFGHLKHKLWSKERSGVKMAIWLPTTKSQESIRFPRVQVACDIPLKSSWRGIQLFFRPHCNWRSTCEVMGPQSCKSPNCANSGTLTWESRNKMPFECDHAERCREYYKGEGGGFPQVQAMMSLMNPRLPVAHLNTKSVWTMH
jgi:hypothetical protein